MYVCVCVGVGVGVWVFPLMYLHTPTSVSAYSVLTCPHTPIMCPHISTNASLIRCVLILLLMCPHTPTNVS